MRRILLTADAPDLTVETVDEATAAPLSEVAARYHVVIPADHLSEPPMLADGVRAAFLCTDLDAFDRLRRLALTGDLVCAAADAKFKAGFPGIGAVPDLALAYTLPRAVGMIRAKELLFSNREVGAAEAHAMGFVSHVAEPAALMDTAIGLATTLAAGPTIAFGLTKQLLQRAYELPLEGYLEFEGMAQTTAFGSADFAEGVAAFRGKRKAVFEGG